MFLFLLLFGTIVMALSILTLSFDESKGWDKDLLDAACISFPWLLSLGYITIYCALFMKLWRIDMVLQPTRRVVKVTCVTPPFIILSLAAIALLLAWTLIDPLEWERELDLDTGESHGECQSDNSSTFFGTLGGLMATSTLLTAYMAWKTADVDRRFSESSWILYTIVLQCQVLIVGVPILIVLENEQATDATYLGRILLIWTVPVSTVLMIFGPKIKGILFGSSEMPKRGSIGQVRVSSASTLLNHTSISDLRNARSQRSIEERSDSVLPETFPGEKTPSKIR